MTSLGSEAVFVKDPMSYEETIASPVPLYLGPAISGALLHASRQLVSRPLTSVRAMSAPKDVLSFALWLTTASALGITRVLRPDLSESPLTHLLPRTSRPRNSPRAASVALAMIVQNEEQRLERCLDSAVGWVSEIVVVDGGSTDSTREIAKSFGARVVNRPFDRDYAAQRNAGLRLVSAPWVLVLDADEMIPPELPPILDHLSSSGEVDGAFIHVLNQFEGEDSPWSWPERKLRFFRSGHLMEGRIHEKISTVKRLAYLPMSGPFILHRKTLFEQWDREKQYFEIDPSYYSQEDALRISRWRNRGGDESTAGNTQI
jgi:Glycosyl transferase family 2